MFTIDTESGFPDAVLITSAYGLGENVVQGAVNPDEFYVFKKTLLQGKAPILNRRLGTKEIRMVYEEGSSKLTVNQPTKLHERAEYSITDDEVLQLARWACIIEDHYTGVRNSGKRVPMDIEWAKDGVTGELFIVQARPETVQSNKRKDVLKEYRMKHTDAPFKTLITGNATPAHCLRLEASSLLFCPLRWSLLLCTQAPSLVLLTRSTSAAPLAMLALPLQSYAIFRKSPQEGQLAR